MKITWQLAILLVSYPLSFSFKSILYSLLWETLTLTLQPTVPSPYIQASVNRRHWREGWKEREETASYLFSLIFFFLILFSFQVSLAPKERVGFSLQLLSSVLLSVPPPFTAGTNGQEVSICSSEIWVPKPHTSPHIGILASAVTSSPISVFISYCLWLNSVFPVYSLTCPDPVKLVSSIKSPLYKIPSVISLLPNEPWLLQYLEV